MTLIYISDAEIPSERANAVNIVKMCEAFTPLFKRVILVTPRFSDPGANDHDLFTYYDVRAKFEVVSLRSPKIPGSLFFYSIKVLVWTLRGHLYNKSGVFVFGRSPFSICLNALAGFDTGIDLHGRIWSKGFVRQKVFQFMVRLKKVKFFTFNTPELMESFQTRFGRELVRSKLLLALPNGASVVTANLSRTPFVFRGKGALKVGYTGSFLPGRGIDLIMTLARRLPELEFHLAGGPLSEVSRLEKTDISNVFFYGHIPFRDTERFRGGCDILLAPYQRNASVSSGEITVDYMSPIKIFEYMSAGKAIVCSDLPVVRSILNSQNALLVSPDDVDRWVTALEKLTNIELREKLGQAAKSVFESRYTWDHRAKKITEIITMFA